MEQFIHAGLETPKEDLDCLAWLVKESRKPGAAKTFAVEVGSWAGRTARVMADAGSLVWCVDTWQGSIGDVFDDTERMVREAGGSDVMFQVFCKNAGARLFRSIFPCRGPSVLWASVWPYKADLVFIDADHRYEAVKADIAAWRGKVRSGGYMAFHDYGVFEGVRDAVNEEFPPPEVLSVGGKTMAFIRMP